ncbi:V-type ATP synthase subunit F [Acidobacteriota bacterium]
MFDRVAVIGDTDLVFPLKTLGIKTYSPQTNEDAGQILQSLEEEKIALCFLHEKFLEPLKEIRAILGKKFCPVVVGFSDYREITDHLGEMMRNLAIKATGSDFLVKQRGQDETR